jgi:pimeloyl-ACP methyl ester carboxylesterase
LVDLKAVESFANTVPCKTHTVEEAGHFLFFEQPNELSKLIAQVT